MRRSEAEEKLYRDFGERLKYARMFLGLSQAEFAAQLRIAASDYSRCERGRLNPTLPMLRGLKRWTGRSVDWFLGVES